MSLEQQQDEIEQKMMILEAIDRLVTQTNELDDHIRDLQQKKHQVASRIKELERCYATSVPIMPPSAPELPEESMWETFETPMPFSIPPPPKKIKLTVTVKPPQHKPIAPIIEPSGVSPSPSFQVTNEKIEQLIKTHKMDRVVFEAVKYPWKVISPAVTTRTHGILCLAQREVGLEFPLYSKGDLVVPPDLIAPKYKSCIKANEIGFISTFHLLNMK